MFVRIGTAFAAAGVIAIAVPAALAQEPPPEAVWTGSFGAGLAATRGNRDTSTVNLSYDARRAEGPFVSFRSKGLLLRGSTDGELTASRVALEGRGDRRFNNGTTLFAQTQYLRDRFREIDYLVAPTVGLAYQFMSDGSTEVGVNAGVGTVWEKNLGRDVEFDGALTAGQQLKQRVSETAEFTQSLAALWKMRDLADSLYTLGVGLAASVTTRTQLKIELVNTYKNQQPEPTLKKNDVSLLLSFVFKY